MASCTCRSVRQENKREELFASDGNSVPAVRAFPLSPARGELVGVALLTFPEALALPNQPSGPRALLPSLTVSNCFRISRMRESSFSSYGTFFQPYPSRTTRETSSNSLTVLVLHCQLQTTISPGPGILTGKASTPNQL